MTSRQGGSQGTNDGQIANFLNEMQRPNQYQSDLTQSQQNEQLIVGSYAQAVAATQLLAGTAHAYQSGPLRWDEDISRFLGIYAVHGGPGATYGKPAAKMFARSGTSSAFIVWLLVIIIGVKEAPLREQLFNLYIGIIISSGIVRILRILIPREKPHWTTSDEIGAVIQDVLERHCFPSGSAAQYALSASFVVVNYRYEPFITIVAATFVFCGGLVSIMLGRHYLTDVVFGWLLGILVYVFIRKVIWLPSDKCERFIRPFKDTFHL